MARLDTEEVDGAMENEGARFRFKTEACCCWFVAADDELRPDFAADDDNETVFKPCGVIIFNI